MTSVIYFTIAKVITPVTCHLLSGFDDADGVSSTWCSGEFQSRLGGDDTLLDGVCMRIVLVMGILGIGIDCSDVFLSWFEEVEFDRRGMAVLAGGATHKPVTGAFGLAGSHDISAWLSLQVAGVVPIHRHVLDELEGIHVFLVVLYHVGCHLQRAVHRDIECQLAGQRGVDMIGVVGVVFTHIHLKNTRGIVHRSALQPCEGKNGGMEGLAAVGGLVLSAACCLIANEVGPGTTKACRTYGLVGIDHNMMLGSLLDAIEVVVHHPLTIMILPPGDDIAHIATFHGSVAILIHQLVGSLQMALVVASGSRGLVVHLQTDSL